MPTFAKYLIKRLLIMVITIFIISLLLYGVFYLFTTPEVRAAAYVPPWNGRGDLENLIETVIKEHGFRDPFLVQYGRWVGKLLHGDWGYSTSVNDDVLDVLVMRTPATIELLIFSLLLFVPLGLFSGVVTGWKHGTTSDFGFRISAFIATSMPPFVLGLMLLSIFYISLHWFLPGRLSPSINIDINSSGFRTITGLLTVDGLLNLRPEVTVDAIRHLLLPAITLSLAYWAALGRVTRAAVIEELNRDYVTTARGKGLQQRQVIWRHVFRNAMVPGLNSIALSAAMFLTVAFVVEIIFNYPGVSRPVTPSAQDWWISPDVDLAMGFAVYSTLLVLPLMLILDIAMAIIDPRLREGVSE